MEKKIGLIGCQGRMGAMLSRRWQSAKYSVCGIDLPLTSEKLDRVAKNNAVILCIPAGVMAETLQILVPHLDGSQILLDITSVKIQPLRQMNAAYSGPVVGTHPLFGPHPDPRTPLKVCLVPGNKATEEILRESEALFTDISCIPFRSTAEEHDRAAAAIQGLNFITNLAYFATLARQKEILPYLTPSFTRRMDAARKMLTEDAALFEWLFEANPLSQEAVRRYRSFLNVAAGGDIDILVRHAAWWWKE